MLKNILMSKIVSLSFLCVFTSFREPHYCKMSDNIVRNFVEEVAQPRRLILSGTGGAMMDDIQEIYISFFSNDTLNVSQARVLYIEMMEELLHRVNFHDKIRPYLHNFPFREDNIKLVIRFVNAEGNAIRDGHVASMGIAKDHLIYFAAYDPVTENYYTINRELYEEARRMVMDAKSD